MTEPAHEGDTLPSPRARIGQRVGRYQILSVLGQGGMGVVFEAEDTTLKRRVALKLLPEDATRSAEHRARFMREARAAASLVHPNIATLFDTGEIDGEVFLAMERIEGETLRARLRAAGGPLAVDEAIRIVRAVAKGLSKAHDAGVIHRDVKPENVMITWDGDVKILDFGLAKATLTPDTSGVTTDLATIQGQGLGSPGYMSPEQARGTATDERTDVFALGVMLYELVTGERPFVGQTALDVLFAAANHTPPPPSSKNPAVPPSLDAVILRCLSKDPDERYRDAGAVITALGSASAPPIEPHDGGTRGVPPNPPGSHESRGGARSEGQAPSSAKAPASAQAHDRRGAWAAAGVLLAVTGAALFMRRSGPDLGPAASAVPLNADPKGGKERALVPRRPCTAEEQRGRECAEVAWCDTSGKVIGCCGLGLVPSGEDGICTCAPGGTSVSEVLARGCAEPSKDASDAMGRAKQAAVDAAIKCFLPYHEQHKTDKGTLAVTFWLTPEGEVMDARTERSTLPQADAQACALRALRATKFPPPRAEDVGKQLGFGFMF